MIRCINIDWLEVFCLEPNEKEYDAQYFINKGYDVRQRAYGTPQYSQMFTILDAGHELLEIRRKPYSLRSQGGIFERGACHIRLSNRTCYDKAPVNVLRKFLVAHGYIFKSISRIDIALDFNEFDNGLQVTDFIQSYVWGEISKVNQSNVSMHGSDKWNCRDINSLKWGSPSSPNTTKLYNKSLEMRQTKQKFYIRDRWEEAGLDISRDVWRIEFSLKSQFQTIKTRVGKTRIKSLSDYDTHKKLFFQFVGMQQKYFDFRNIRYNSKGEPIRKYDCERVSTISYKQSDVIFVPCRNLTNNISPTKTDKLLCKRLEEIVRNEKISNYIRKAADELLQYFHLHKRIHINTAYSEVLRLTPEIGYDCVSYKIQNKGLSTHDSHAERLLLTKLMDKYHIHAIQIDCPF